MGARTLYLWPVLKAMRPHQWVKNLFVIAPLVFAEHADESGYIALAAAAFGLFCVFSGCVYILNDLLDVEADRQHPVKRFRPIASGLLPVPVAWVALLGLLIGGILASLAISPGFAAIGGGYFVFNIAYSTRLKHIAFVDVLSIATGFILRILGGGVAIAVPLSPWLVICTFLVSTFLGLGKRKHELVASGERADKQRAVLSRYDLNTVTRLMNILAVLTAMSYVAYCLLARPTGAFDPRDLVWTVPFVIMGLWRFVKLTHRYDQGRSPTDLMLRDPLFMVNLALYGAAVIAIIYLL